MAKKAATLNASSPVGLSCGHRVARSNRGEYGQGYWCPACRVWRMSGRVGTGEHAFDGFKLLAELTDGLEVDFKGLALADYQLDLLNTLGVTPVNYRRDVDGDELATRRTRRHRDPVAEERRIRTRLRDGGRPFNRRAD